MSKAVLVLDMPGSCSKCKFMYEFQGIKKCQLMNCLNNGFSKISQNNFTKQRHDKCPLRELPEKRTEEAPVAYTHFGAYNDGWNACIDEITGEHKPTVAKSATTEQEG